MIEAFKTAFINSFALALEMEATQKSQSTDSVSVGPFPRKVSKQWTFKRLELEHRKQSPSQTPRPGRDDQQATSNRISYRPTIQQLMSLIVIGQQDKHHSIDGRIYRRGECEMVVMQSLRRFFSMHLTVDSK